MTAEENLILDFLLTMLIPASAERRLPSGAEVGFARYLSDAKLLDWAGENAALIRAQALKSFGKEFSLLPPADRALVVDQAVKGGLRRFLDQLTRHLVRCYYRHEQVVRALGQAARPPFPEGHHVEEGDFLLLEPVYLRGKIYRDA